MGNRDQRSNREKKKPKQDKPKPAAGPGFSTWTSQNKGDDKKK
jgi:hypothetical protein